VPAEAEVRAATSEDAAVVARLLHDFNVEFEAPTPGVEALSTRVAELIGAGEATVMLVWAGGDAGRLGAGAGPVAAEPLGLAVLRLRPSLWARSLDAYLEELYVVPGRRGEGLGRALMEATMEAARAAGAGRMELGTSTDDVAARGLYESCGFTNLEAGATMLFYERDL
jgi:GNAT superfamily N-acetyltransferase